jgi:polyferredoxin
MDWNIIGDLLRLTALGGLGVAGIVAILIWKKNLASRVTFIRFVIQAISFAAIFYIFTYTIPLLYVLIILLTMTLFIGKFYCGWLCPFAFVMDVESVVRKAFKKRYRIIPDKLNKSLHQLRYVILLFFLLTPIVLWFLEPPPNMDFAILEAQLLAGPFRAYSVILAPLIPLIVSWTTAPLIINGINFSYPYVQDIITWAGTDIGQIISVVFVGLTLVGSFSIRRLWCRFCPHWRVFDCCE